MGISLVTGAKGFIGKHLLSTLQHSGDNVVGLELPGKGSLGPEGIPRILEVEMGNREALREALIAIAPDRVYHLAGLVDSLDHQALFSSNSLPTINLLECLVETGLATTRVVVSGSAAEYGKPLNGETRLDETAPLRPVSPYGLSKAMQGLIARMYHVNCNMPIICARIFNVSGPGEPPWLVGSAMAKRIAEIEALGSPPVMLVRGLDSERDFVDVRDIAIGLSALMQRGRAGETYNLCSGTATPIRAVLNCLLRLSNAPIRTEERGDPTGHVGVKRVVGDPSRTRRDTGWTKEIPLEQTLADVLDYWRHAIGQGH